MVEGALAAGVVEVALSAGAQELRALIVRTDNDLDRDADFYDEVLTLFRENDVNRPEHLKDACAKLLVFANNPSGGKRALMKTVIKDYQAAALKEAEALEEAVKAEKALAAAVPGEGEGQDNGLRALIRRWPWLCECCLHWLVWHSFVRWLGREGPPQSLGEDAQAMCPC